MKTTQATHTPTPWILNNNKGWHNGFKDRGSIFECHLATGTRVPENQNLTNAAFIVRSVNAHEELLLALKNARYALEVCKEKLDPSGKGLWKSLDDIDEAIAKAEARS